MAQAYYDAIDTEVEKARRAGHQMSRHEARQIVAARNPELRPDHITPHSTGTTAAPSGHQTFADAIAAEMEKRPGMSRSQAAMAVNKKHPELRLRLLNR